MAKRKPEPNNDTELLGEVLKNFGQDEKSHYEFARKVEDYYSAYRGVLEIKSKAAGWTSREHPPYIHQVIETILASVIDPRPTWSVKPRPRVADPEEIARLREGAKANELLLAQQADCAKLGEKQVLFAKQELIAGTSVYKTSWDYQEGVRPRLGQVHDEVTDAAGYVIGYQPRTTEVKHTQVTADDNQIEVVDVRDFIWHEAAVSLDKAKRVTHRVLYSMEELRAKEALGIYRNVDKLTETDMQADLGNREESLFQANRGKDMVEVLEQWRRTDTGIRVTAIGNRSVVLQDMPNPFWHGQFPFVVCSSIPDLFRIPGISDVELVQDLQTMLWTLINQRLDNTSLLNNAIVLIRSDVDDVDQFEWAPGAQWLVEDPAQVQVLETTPLPTEMSLQAENRLLQDLQNIPGASPSLLGQIDQTAGTTATEVSLTSSMGQRRISAKKQQFKFSHARVGEQWMSNNQQFIREDRLVAVVGPGGAQDFDEIKPMMIQGDYFIDLEAMDESLLRQERKAEAQATFQVALEAAPVFAALSQGQSDTPMLNVKAFMDDVLEAAGISDKERYYMPKSVSPPQLQAPPGGGNGGPPQGGPGVTAPQSVDQASPSNAYSMNPAVDMQRMLAMGGGPANAPAG